MELQHIITMLRSTGAYRDEEGESTNAAQAELDQMLADANRYRAIRSVLCEPNKAVQDRIIEGIDRFMNDQPDIAKIEAVTPDRADEIVDALIAIVKGARNADS